MDLVERSRARLLGIIYLDVGVRVLVRVNRRPTIVKDRPGAANHVGGAPSERERLCGAGLLAHDVGKEWGGRRGHGGHLGGILINRGLDGVRGGSVGTVG